MPETNKLEDMKDMWYRNAPVAFELVKCMNRRESVFLATNRKLTHRCLKMNAVRFFYKSAHRFHFFDREYQYNIYSSVALFPRLPMFSFNWDTKKVEQKEFNEHFRDYLEGYDFVVDLDNPDLKAVHESGKRLKAMLDKYKIRYHVKFSGTKGFHFVVQFEDLPEQLKLLNPDDLVVIFKRFAYELKYMHKVEDIDETIYDLRRILKTPYSVVYPTYLIALPLTDAQFEQFDLDIVSLDYWLTNTDKIRNRGLLTRNHSEGRDNLLKMINSVARQGERRSWLFNKIMGWNKPYLCDILQERGLFEGGRFDFTTWKTIEEQER